MQSISSVAIHIWSIIILKNHRKLVITASQIDFWSDVYAEGGYNLW